MTIMRTIVTLGKLIGLSVIEEGVELESQIQHLLDQGCDLVQVFYYRKPMPFRDFMDYIMTENDMRALEQPGRRIN